MMGWSLGSRYFADMKVDSIYGSQGLGFSILNIRVEIALQNRNQEDIVVIDNITGKVEVKAKQGKGREDYLGRLRRVDANDLVQTYDYASKKSITFEIELDPKRIEALEKIRAGGELNFKFTIYARARDRNGIQEVSESITYNANQSIWVSVLEGMGYRKTMLLEIPVLSEEISPSFAKAVENLKQAQLHLLNGHYRDSVATCRDVLECLAMAVGDDKETEPMNFDNQKGMDKETRFRLVRKALRVVTHAAKHSDEVTVQIEWNYEDAKATVAIAAILVSLATSYKAKEAKE